MVGARVELQVFLREEKFLYPAPRANRTEYPVSAKLTFTGLKKGPRPRPIPVPTATTRLKNTLTRTTSNLGIVSLGNNARTVRKPGKNPSVKSPRRVLINESTGAGLPDMTRNVSVAGIAIPA